MFPGITVALGLAYAYAGRLPQALSRVEEAWERPHAMTETAPASGLVVHLGHVYLLAGRVDEASRLARQAVDLSRARQEYGSQARALWLLGEITARREPCNDAQAERACGQALDLAHALGRRPLQAHCHRGLGMLYARTGQREQARTALATAIDLYRAMEMTSWLPETEAALAQVEAR